MTKEEFLQQLVDMGDPSSPFLTSEVVPPDLPHVVVEGTLFVVFEDGPLCFAADRDDRGKMHLDPKTMRSEGIVALFAVWEANMRSVRAALNRHFVDG